MTAPGLEVDTPANNAAVAKSTGSVFLIFMSLSLRAPVGPAAFQQDLLDLRKYVDPTVPILPKPRAESTKHHRSVPRAADVTKSINGRTGSTAVVLGRAGGASGLGTKCKSPGERGISGAEGRPVLPSPCDDSGPCRVGPGNCTPSLSAVGSRTGAPV